MNIENCRAIKSANVLILILQISINIRALAPLLCNSNIQAIPACCCSSKCIVNNGDNIKCDQNFWTTKVMNAIAQLKGKYNRQTRYETVLAAVFNMDKKKNKQIENKVCEIDARQSKKQSEESTEVRHKGLWSVRVIFFLLRYRRFIEEECYVKTSNIIAAAIQFRFRKWQSRLVFRDHAFSRTAR